jgi:hypothetical protein
MQLGPDVGRVRANRCLSLADRPDEASPAHVLLNRLFQIIAGISRFDHGAA